MEYSVLIEGEENFFGDFEDVIDDVQNRTYFEVDAQDMAVWLPKMELGESVQLGDDCKITRIR
ncbi:hypothetical protein [Paenibacillus medicaginis]|uniref:Uncharacterized protein n=1 Tax=Paenibacillus medicaginis TaxID=1470560 RepID=A0ABV5C129_9BACL